MPGRLQNGYFDNVVVDVSENWKEVFKTHVPNSAKSNREDLHKLIEVEALQFKRRANR